MYIRGLSRRAAGENEVAEVLDAGWEAGASVISHVRPLDIDPASIGAITDTIAGSVFSLAR